ncbi:MAG: MACPF domain-containing protein [Bacteroides sp.]|nr:MACPF domain-containing protein [Bacteroides sp.]
MDIRTLEEELGDVVTIIQGNSSEGKYYFWGPEQECREDFAIHAEFSEEEIRKYLNLFKQALTPVFGNDDVFPELYYTYYGYSSVITYLNMKFFWRERWHSENHLSEEFRSALTELTAEEIIETFGTHIITGLRKGSRLDLYYRSTSSDLSHVHDWFMYSSNYYLRLGRVPQKPDGEPPLKDNIYFEFVEGSKPNPNACMVDILHYEGELFTFEGMNSPTEEHATLVGFNQKMLPIYELVTDPDKKEELKNAFEKYLGASE